MYIVLVTSLFRGVPWDLFFFILEMCLGWLNEGGGGHWTSECRWKQVMRRIWRVFAALHFFPHIMESITPPSVKSLQPRSSKSSSGFVIRRCLYSLTGVHMFWIQLKEHDLTGHTPFYTIAEKELRNSSRCFSPQNYAIPYFKKIIKWQQFLIFFMCVS